MNKFFWPDHKVLLNVLIDLIPSSCHLGILSSEVNGYWQVDLIDFQKYNERGFKWILTVVDVFSKYLWARPLKNKSAEEVKEAFSCIFKERRPIVLQTDNSKEFKNTVLADYLSLWGITLGWCQDNGNRSNQESKFDFLATHQRLVKIDQGQQKIKIVCTN